MMRNEGAGVCTTSTRKHMMIVGVGTAEMETQRRCALAYLERENGVVVGWLWLWLWL